MSLVVSDIVLKNKFAIKRYEIALYTYNIWYLNEINENNDSIDKIFLCETLRSLFTNWRGFLCRWNHVTRDPFSSRTLCAAVGQGTRRSFATV